MLQAAHAAAVDLSALVHKTALSMPDEMISPGHNINKKEKFKSVQLLCPGCEVFGDHAADSSVPLRCEHFSEYGDGHRLSYFRYNLPRVGLADNTLQRLSAFPPVANEVFASRHSSNETGRALTGPHRWRLTLNHYPASEGGERPGFPWHRDLKANGASTMILALGGSAQLQFGRLVSSGSHDGMLYADHDVTTDSEVEVLETVTVEPADMLVLTGEGRWELLHRVLPGTISEDSPDRASAVWGVW
jgi:hypothetical protein